MKGFFLLLALLAGSLPAGAETKAGDQNPFSEGVEYAKLKTAQSTSTDGKVEVVELFWYGCPHCYRFEPTLEAWIANKPEYVEFVRIPAVLNPRWELHARAYYAAKQLGVLDKVHAPMFDAIHVKKRRLDSEAALEALFAENGVPGEDFRKAFKSFSVNSQVQRARVMTKRYEITGVPSMVVNGKYRTAARMAGSNEGVLEVVNYLAASEAGKP